MIESLERRREDRGLTQQFPLWTEINYIVFNVEVCNSVSSVNGYGLEDRDSRKSVFYLLTTYRISVWP